MTCLTYKRVSTAPASDGHHTGPGACNPDLSTSGSQKPRGGVQRAEGGAPSETALRMSVLSAFCLAL